jgi:hypothetical protein
LAAVAAAPLGLGSRSAAPVARPGPDSVSRLEERVCVLTDCSRAGFGSTGSGSGPSFSEPTHLVKQRALIAALLAGFGGGGGSSGGSGFSFGGNGAQLRRCHTDYISIELLASSGQSQMAGSSFSTGLRLLVHVLLQVALLLTLAVQMVTQSSTKLRRSSRRTIRKARLADSTSFSTTKCVFIITFAGLRAILIICVPALAGTSEQSLQIQAARERQQAVGTPCQFLVLIARSSQVVAAG